jgi:hypothetical protein
MPVTEHVASQGLAFRVGLLEKVQGMVLLRLLEYRYGRPKQEIAVQENISMEYERGDAGWQKSDLALKRDQILLLSLRPNKSILVLPSCAVTNAKQFVLQLVLGLSLQFVFITLLRRCIKPCSWTGACFMHLRNNVASRDAPQAVRNSSSIENMMAGRDSHNNQGKPGK